MAASRDLEFLRPHCATDRQEEMLDAYMTHGSLEKASVALKVDKARIGRVIQALKKRAAMAGEGEHFTNLEIIPNPLTLKGTSTLYKDGLPTIQWVKTTVDAEKREAAVHAWIAALCEGVEGKGGTIPPPAVTSDSLLCCIPVGDPHFGAKAWSEEAGEDFDLAEAEARTKGAVDMLIKSTPAADTALFINLGDAFHADDESAATPASGHRLDVDTRWAKVLDVTARTFVYCVFRLLEKHKRVIVWNKRGNHDPTASMALAAILRAYFKDEPRVEIPYNPSLFSYHKHGRVLIGSTHGHGPKMPDLPLIMAADRAEDWGSTIYRHWMVGHIHHKTLKEHPGCHVESFNTLASSDAWHHGKGYRARKNMQAIIFHSEFGEVMRHTCDLTMIRAAA